MTYDGFVQNGVILLQNDVALPEGTRVRVVPVALESGGPAEDSSLADRLSEFIGIVDDMPADAAEEHDHYLYGAPRREG